MKLKILILIVVIIVLIGIGMLVNNSKDSTKKYGNTTNNGADIHSTTGENNQTDDNINNQTNNIFPYQLKDIIENVNNSDGYIYNIKDDQKNSMHTLKIIEKPFNSSFSSSENGKYIGIYHNLKNNTFNVKIATSNDLINWKYITDIDSHASQPDIKALPNGGFLITYEADNHNISLNSSKTWIRIRYYSGIDNLFKNIPDKTFDAQHTLADLDRSAEGTPNIYSVNLSPDINNSTIDIGFHYYMNRDVDRQARGTLVNFNNWTTKIEYDVNNAILQYGVKGNIGGRYNILYNGSNYNLVEGQFIKKDFSSWRIFLYDWNRKSATQLDIKTHRGTTAFANPSITKVNGPDGNPAIVIGLFIPSSGAAKGESGELIYYKSINE